MEKWKKGEHRSWKNKIKNNWISRNECGKYCNWRNKKGEKIMKNEFGKVKLRKNENTENRKSNKETMIKEQKIKINNKRGKWK